MPADLSPMLEQLSDKQRQILVSWLEQFEKSWGDDRLLAFVVQLPPPGQPLRLAALHELVRIDLERQWQNGRRVRLEGYLKDYPELGTPATVSVHLIYAEYRVRRQVGVPMELPDFAKRFPPQAEALRRLVESHRAGAPQPRPDQAVKATSATLDSTPSSVRPAEEPRPLPRQFGRYRIIKELGHGGMGTVYLAHDTQLDRRVALKVPHFSAKDGHEVMERFFREARAAATIMHSSICPVYDVGELDGHRYLTMAYIEGKPLSSLLEDDKLPAQRQVALIGHQLAQALQEAHTRGVIHRDLKPSNVMVNQNNVPIIMDFGLARLTTSGEDARLTQSGTILGTPAYMSPEQVNGDVKAMGPGCDIYSLGVILYELLTGRLPFEGPMMAMLGQILTQPPEPPSLHRPDVDPRLEAICLKAMAKKPAERHASMTELANELAVCLQSPGATSPTKTARDKRRSPGSPPLPPRKPGGPVARPRLVSPWLWGIAGGIAVLMVLVLVIYVATTRRAPAIADEKPLTPARPGPTASPEPTSAPAYCKRADEFLRKGDYDKAVTAYTQALAIDPNCLDAFIGRGLVRQGKQFYDVAIEDFKEVLKRNTEHAPALCCLGKVYQLKGEPDKAIEYYYRAIRIDATIRIQGDDVLALAVHGLLLAGKKKYDEAIADFERAIGMEKNQVQLAQLYIQRGDIHVKRGDLGAAIRDYHQALRQPNLDTPENRKKLAKIYDDRGRELATKGDLTGAIADFEEVGHYDKDLAERNRERFAKVYVSRGEIYSNKSEFAKAIADFDRAIELVPQDVTYLTKRAIALMHNSDYEKALSDCNQTLALKPEDPELYYCRGMIFRRKGDHQKEISELTKAIDDFNQAISDFSRGIELKPADAWYYYRERGVANRGKEDYDNAFKDLSKAIQLKPDDASAYNYRGLVRSEDKKKDFQKAIDDVNEAIKLEPANSIYHSNRGSYYFKLNEIDKALMDLEMAINLNNKSAHAYQWRAKVFEKQGDREKAEKDKKKADELKKLTK